MRGPLGRFGPLVSTVQFATAPSAETLSGETLPLTFQAFSKRFISRMKRRCWCSAPTGS